MDTRERDYIAFTSQPPYGVALVRRRFDGRIAVGAVCENPRALRPILESLKTQLAKARIDLGKVIGVFNDDETSTDLALMAEDIIPIGWTRIFKTLETARQSLESAVSTQGPASSKFQIDKDGPGAEFLAAQIDNRTTGGVYDAVALCCLQIEEDFPVGARSGEIKVLSSLDDLREPSRKSFPPT
jgi:hypothetical protein